MGPALSTTIKFESTTDTVVTNVTRTLLSQASSTTTKQVVDLECEADVAIAGACGDVGSITQKISLNLTLLSNQTDAQKKTLRESVEQDLKPAPGASIDDVKLLSKTVVDILTDTEQVSTFASVNEQIVKTLNRGLGDTSQETAVGVLTNVLQGSTQFLELEKKVTSTLEPPEVEEEGLGAGVISLIVVVVLMVSVAIGAKTYVAVKKHRDIKKTKNSVNRIN